MWPHTLQQRPAFGCNTAKGLIRSRYNAVCLALPLPSRPLGLLWHRQGNYRRLHRATHALPFGTEPQAVLTYLEKHHPEAVAILLGEAIESHLDGNTKQSTCSNSASANIVVEELTEGKINFTYKVAGPSGSVLMKYAAPYVKSIGEDFQLSQERMRIEAEAMRIMHDYCPQHIPRVYGYDPAASILTMQFLGPPHQKLLTGLSQGLHYPQLARHISSLLARGMYYTSAALIPAGQRSQVLESFANREVVSANQHVVILDPFDPACPANHWTSPQLDDLVAGLRSDSRVQGAVCQLSALYRSQPEALIHNDLHAGNLLTTPASTFLIDYEFASYGPLAFDLGCMLGNMLLTYFALGGADVANASGSGPGAREDGQQVQQSVRAREEHREWLLGCMVDVWEGFCEEYGSLVHSHGNIMQGSSASSGGAAGVGGGPCGSGTWTAGDRQALLRDALGYAGCCMTRLVIGMHHFPLLLAIADVEKRAAAERHCLQLSWQLLRQHQAGDEGGFVSIQQVASAAELLGRIC